jgi:methylase of polypeptide subunit release factors
MTDWPQARNYIMDDGGERPSVFAAAFAEAIKKEIEPGKTRFLDIGCGSGIIGIHSLIENKAAFVTFNDVLHKMISAARVNVDWNIKQGKILKSQADFITGKFTDIPAEVVAKHSLLGFNPPQLPRKYLNSIDSNQVTKSFRDGGSDGLDIARQFFEWYAGLETPKPDAVIQLSSFLGWNRITEAVGRHKIRWRELARQRVPLRDRMWDDAKELSINKKERLDRSLVEGPGNSWTKELIAILLTPDK